MGFSRRQVKRKVYPVLRANSGLQFPLEQASGKHVPFWARILGWTFRLRRHPETASQSEPEFRDGFSVWAAVGKARPTLRCRGVFFAPAPCAEFDSPRYRGDPLMRGTAGRNSINIASVLGRGFARRIRVFASQIRAGFGRLPASSPAG